MLKTILGNESVYMPLLHFMLPVNMGSQSLFSEIWVEQNDGRKEKDRENERTIRMLIKMEVKRLGLFDIVLDYRESGEVGIQLYYPRKLSGEEREMENALNTMITKNSMSPRAVTLKAMKEPLRPIDVLVDLQGKRRLSMSEFSRIFNQKAVALSYDEERGLAPAVVASGSGFLAERIVELAVENGVPVYEDNSLANVLSQMEVGSEIPPGLYQLVVDIYVYFLNYTF